ncbi:MAG: calcium/sodium antiporter, partial [Peptostreptococcaceae bacterium]|nr:calcium/sodium antiporter [Peptostreptococcaceae bacterium]
MNYLTLGIGLLILVKGADVLVESASRLAKLLKVPSFIVGLLIVAIGTSAPEAAIGVYSGIQGTNLITMGDVVGSSIVNITVVLGITAMIFSLKVDALIPRREMLISIFVQICLVIMIFTAYTLSRVEAGILLAGMFIFLGYVYMKFKKHSGNDKNIMAFEDEIFHYVEKQDDVLYEEMPEEKETRKIVGLKFHLHVAAPKNDSKPKLLILLFLGLAGLIGGASLAVNSAVQIAHTLGLSEEFIGLTIVALGTSLPELTTCLIALSKKEEGIAVGNVIGSNILNVLFVL